MDSFYRDECEMVREERNRARSNLDVIYKIADGALSSCKEKECSKPEHILARRILAVFGKARLHDKKNPVRFNDGYT